MKFNQLRLNDFSYSNTQLKQDDKYIKTEFGNLSTSRAKAIAIKQFIADDIDSGRATYNNNNKEQFTKLQNLEFQNGMFQMQMSHIHKRKNVEQCTIRQQLQQLHLDIQNIQMKVTKDKEPIKHKIDSELSSNKSSSSCDSYHQQQIQSKQNIFPQFKELYDVCNSHDKLCSLFKQYCGTLQTIEIDIIQQNYTLLIEQLIKFLCDIIKKFNSIKLDTLKIKPSTPDKQVLNFEFGTFNKEQKKIARISDSPAFLSNDSLDKMKLKLIDHYEKVINNDEKENNIQLLNKNIQNIYPVRKTVTQHQNRRQRSELMPSLKRKQKKQQQFI